MDGSLKVLYFSFPLSFGGSFPMCAAARKSGAPSPLGRRAVRKIPVFSLYGEAAEVAPEFIHVEDIRSRSELYRWEIAEHRHHGLFQALLLIEGAAHVKLDERVEDVHAPFVLAMPSGVVHAFRFTPGAVGHVLTIEENALSRGPSGRPHPAAGLTRPALVDLSGAPDQAARLAILFEQIAIELHENRSGAGDVLLWLASAVLTLTLRLGDDAVRATAGGAPEAAAFHAFRALVESHMAERWPIARYARAMRLSESRLNRICRAAAGRSALEIVQDRLTLEARRRLIHVAGSVSSLAYELGFEDPAYFWRFFKRRTGLTPQEFRARHDARRPG